MMPVHMDAHEQIHMYVEGDPLNPCVITGEHSKCLEDSGKQQRKTGMEEDDEDDGHRSVNWRQRSW
jgi:hypothetical protein